MKPWNFDMNGCETSHGLPIITKANGHLVAQLASHSKKDARLIAAAPALLSALDAVLEYAERYASQNDEMPGGGCYRDIERARLAIARATGKQVPQ